MVLGPALLPLFFSASFQIDHVSHISSLIVILIFVILALLLALGFHGFFSIFFPSRTDYLRSM
jgi:hypothetical protein